MKLCLRPLGPVLVSAIAASILAIGCSSSSEMGTDSEEEAADSTEQDIVASCKYPRRYAALLTEGTCTTVSAAHGQWVPSPVFVDAPQEGACVYSWVGEKKGSRIDRGVIQNWVGDRGVLTAMCGSGNNGIDPAHVQQIPGLSNFSLAGSVGCDVCGILKNGHVWIVIPPERDTHREFIVPLTSGGYRAFSIQAADNAHVMSVALPPPPAGAQYVNGRIKIE